MTALGPERQRWQEEGHKPLGRAGRTVLRDWQQGLVGCTAMARACPRVGGREGRKAAGGRGLEPGDLQAPGGLLTTSAASPTAGTCKAGSLEPSGQLKREAELCWQLERARRSPSAVLLHRPTSASGPQEGFSLWFLALLLAEGKKKGNCPGLPGSRPSW